MALRLPASQLWDSLSARLNTQTRGPVERLRSKVEKVKDRLLTVSAFVLLLRVVRDLIADDATHMAAGVAYYAILSLFPMAVGLIALLSLVLEADTVRSELLGFLQTYLPGSNITLESNISVSGGVHGFLGALSVLGLFWVASSVFGAISRTVNRAWGVRGRPFYVAKLHQLGMAFSVGLLFFLSLSTTAAMQFLGRVDLPGVGQLGFLEHDGLSALVRSVPFLFTLTIFLLIYKFVPNTTTHWRYVWPGALLAAVAFELGKSVFVFYLDNFADLEKVYGSLGSVMVVLVWTYLSSFILILGAAVSSEYGRMREEVAQGKPIESRGASASDLEDEEELW